MKEGEETTTYNSIEEIPPYILEAGGTFQVKTSNLHPDLTKRTKGAVGVIYESGGGEEGLGPSPQGPWLPLIIIAIKLLLVAVFTVVVATVITSSITTIVADPVSVSARDSKDRPTLLTTSKGRVLTIGYDSEGSAYIVDESDPTPPFGIDLSILVPIGIIAIIIIVMLLYWDKSRKGGETPEPEKKSKPKPEEEDETNESED